MQDKPGWPPHMAIETHPALHLPPRPGVKREPVIDCCPLCQTTHWTVDSFNRCKQQHSHRDQ